MSWFGVKKVGSRSDLTLTGNKSHGFCITTSGLKFISLVFLKDTSIIFC